MSYPLRRAALRALLRAADPGLDALLVTDLVNIRYLTGFTGSNAALLLHVRRRRRPAGSAPTAATAPRPRSEVPDLPTVIERACARALAAAGRTAGARARLRVRPGHRRRARELRRRRPRASPCTGPRPGPATAHGQGRRRGRRAARGLRRRRRRAGRPAGGRRAAPRGAPSATSPSTWSSGCAGTARPARRSPRSSPPGRTRRSRTTGPTDAVLRRGDLVTLDFGALVDGYHSDMTRTVVLGAGRGLAARAVRAGRRGAGGRAGRRWRRAPASPTSTPRPARWCDRAGHGEQFVHALGHGVGLQIHEAPLLAGGSRHAGRRDGGHRGAGGVPGRPGRGADRGHAGGPRRRAAAAHRQPAELVEVG